MALLTSTIGCCIHVCVYVGMYTIVNHDINNDF